MQAMAEQCYHFSHYASHFCSAMQRLWEVRCPRLIACEDATCISSRSAHHTLTLQRSPAPHSRRSLPLDAAGLRALEYELARVWLPWRCHSAYARARTRSGALASTRNVRQWEANGAFAAFFKDRRAKLPVPLHHFCFAPVRHLRACAVLVRCVRLFRAQCHATPRPPPCRYHAGACLPRWRGWARPRMRQLSTERAALLACVRALYRERARLGRQRPWLPVWLGSRGRWLRRLLWEATPRTHPECAQLMRATELMNR